MTRSIIYTYELPGGAKVYIESEDFGRQGPKEVSLEKTPAEMPFDKVIAPIGDVAQSVFEAMKAKVSKPDQITLEFGAALKGGTNLFLVSGTTEATFKVTLSWKKEG